MKIQIDINRETYKKLDRKIHFLNTHDEMTGLYDRRYFDKIIRRKDLNDIYPLSVIIVDINGMKIINRVFGFEVGDEILIKTASALVLAAGTGNTVARWGDDEFVILLPYMDEASLENKCEEIIQLCSGIVANRIIPSIALGSASKKNEAQNINQVILEAEDRMYRHKLLDTKSTHSSIITSLRKALFRRSSETEEHAARMRRVSSLLGKKMGLSRDELDKLYLLSVLHDIGKIAIADKILLKPGNLTDEEWTEMKKHSEIGYQIASGSSELSMIAEYILSHHERWDGKGYPQGLKESEIPKLSRIISIVDTYDVITHERPYKVALSHDEAMNEIRKCAGTQFDPVIVEEFDELFETIWRDFPPAS